MSDIKINGAGTGNTRSRILAVALNLFIERGYDKVSLREIAEQVGVTKAALYYYFPSKENILETLVEPLLSFHQVLLDALESWPNREEWAARMTDFVKWMLPQRRLFELMQSNQAALRGHLRFRHDEEEHATLHKRIEQLLADNSIPLADKVRVIGASVLVMGTIASPFGASLSQLPEEELESVLVDAVNDLLLPCRQVDPASKTAGR